MNFLKKGFTLIEIIIATLILSFGMAACLKLFLALDEILITDSYRYTANNLARDVLEFGEGANFLHPFKMWYKYPPGEKIHKGGGGCPDVVKTAGYGLKEWYFFCPNSYLHPFKYMGDIKQKGLVPTEYPDSVEIYYEAREDADFHNAYREDVKITWTARENEKEALEVSVIPVVANNDQLKLEIQDFWWE